MTSEAAHFPNALSGAAEVREDSAEIKPHTRSKAREIVTGEASIPDVSDEFLLGQVREGAKEALGILFRRHSRAVLNIAYRILRDAAEAEDLVQEVFLLLFQKARLFDAKKGAASSWIIQIAYHRAMNRRHYLTHRQHYNAQGFDEEQTGVGHKPLFIDELAARNLLNRLREQLSEEQRETLELHFFEGYSLGEIAEKTKQTLGNVRHHYYRGLDRLRSNLFHERDA
jgi:RNA polymerase sigma-70 factor, ECF subfamily